MTTQDQTLKSDMLDHTIKLFRSAIHLDPARQIPRTHLELIGQFKASIENVSYTKPSSDIENISYVIKISVRASQFYRHNFNTENYVQFQESFLRIGTVSYYRQTGITVCMCYQPEAGIKEDV